MLIVLLFCSIFCQRQQVFWRVIYSRFVCVGDGDGGVSLVNPSSNLTKDVLPSRLIDHICVVCSFESVYLAIGEYECTKILWITFSVPICTPSSGSPLDSHIFNAGYV